uniref:Uncharacterized protein n=1 Tax=Arundo donax TaxID=35708 RepID=A0A0A9ARJ0_ARUDO
MRSPAPPAAAPARPSRSPRTTPPPSWSPSPRRRRSGRCRCWGSARRSPATQARRCSCCCRRCPQRCRGRAQTRRRTPSAGSGRTRRSCAPRSALASGSR